MCPDRFIIKIVSVTGYFLKGLLIPIIAILMIFTVGSCQKQKYPLENVVVTTGGSVRVTGFDGFIIGVPDDEAGKEYSLPVTVDLATQQGWGKVSTSIAGEGV